MGCGNTRAVASVSSPKHVNMQNVGPKRPSPSSKGKPQSYEREFEEEKHEETKSNNKSQVVNLSQLTVTPSQFVTQKNESIYKSYSLKEKLGEGSFGVVYKALHKVSKEMRAIKFIDRTSVNTEEEKKLMQEIEILRQLVLYMTT